MRRMTREGGVRAPDIHGWVEVSEYEGAGWDGIVNVEPLLTGHPDICVFESLFWPGLAGVGFSTIAPDRGIPRDASRRIKLALATDDYIEIVRPTWILWREIQEMDWEQISWDPEPGRPPHYYSLDAEGRPTDEGPVAGVDQVWERGQPDTFELDGKLFRYQRMTRRRAFQRSWGWLTLLEMMRALAERFGPNRVRLVVYFTFGDALKDAFIP